MIPGGHSAAIPGGQPATIAFDERGLAPAIVQDASTKEVLMLAYVDAESLRRTQEDGTTWFWSRSRRGYWNKGATSGNFQRVVELRYDCDADAVLMLVEPEGPACHTGQRSCFHRIL
ncbi:phosphoribosyl-AMP cyclohydrolase [soil metagenome]|jgi:phosphoribosyl-ATP pyrophosphohydrolase/phosphoribosyl-AMP cyclohydrolase